MSDFIEFKTKSGGVHLVNKNHIVGVSRIIKEKTKTRVVLSSFNESGTNTTMTVEGKYEDIKSLILR